LAKSDLTKSDFEKESEKFIKEDKDPKLAVKDIAEAIQ